MECLPARGPPSLPPGLVCSLSLLPPRLLRGLPQPSSPANLAPTQLSVRVLSDTTLTAQGHGAKDAAVQLQVGDASSYVWLLQVSTLLIYFSLSIFFLALACRHLDEILTTHATDACSRLSPTSSRRWWRPSSPGHFPVSVAASFYPTACKLRCTCCASPPHHPPSPPLIRSETEADAETITCFLFSLLYNHHRLPSEHCTPAVCPLAHSSAPPHCTCFLLVVLVSRSHAPYALTLSPLSGHVVAGGDTLPYPQSTPSSKHCTPSAPPAPPSVSAY